MNNDGIVVIRGVSLNAETIVNIKFSGDYEAYSLSALKELRKRVINEKTRDEIKIHFKRNTGEMYDILSEAINLIEDKNR